MRYSDIIKMAADFEDETGRAPTAVTLGYEVIDELARELGVPAGAQLEMIADMKVTSAPGRFAVIG